jgi:hypothetical protein
MDSRALNELSDFLENEDALSLERDRFEVFIRDLPYAKLQSAITAHFFWARWHTRSFTFS